MVRSTVLALAVATLIAGTARADKPTKAEIAKIGKAAAAFVDAAPRGTGTAFCVHPSGLFITNEHVIRGAVDQKVKLVLDAGLKTQRVLTATVARADKGLDLALLRVTSKDALPSLPLGSDEGIGELADVVTFGFPLGAALSPDRTEYPAITVTAGTVSALRRKAGDLDRIQLDVSVTFGSSGGPVLDENGKVIGVIVSGVPGQRAINNAIPVSHLARFLDAPDVDLVPPELTRATLDKPSEFKARVVALVPGAKEPTVKLVLKADDGPAREFPMTRRDGEFVVTAVPAPKTGDGRVEITARIGSGTVVGRAPDVPLRVGGKPTRLSQIRRVERKPKPLAVLADGRTTVEGEVAGLGPIDIALGGQSVKLDLGRVDQLQVTPPAPVGGVTMTVVVSANGKEVARRETTVSAHDPPAGPAAGSPAPAIAPPALAEAREVRKLPEPFDDVCLGGGGRYLIFHLPKLRKLAVFDVSAGRVTNYIDLPEERVSFAAGLDKLVIGLPKKGVLERWSLATFDREIAVVPPFNEEIGAVLMGHASTGPVLVNARFLDLASLKPLVKTFPDGGTKAPWGPTERLSLAADGSVVTNWGNNSNAWVVEGTRVRRYEEGGLRHVIPGPDGKWIYTAHGVVSQRFTRADPEDANLGYCLPAVRGNYFLSLTSADPAGKGGRFTVYLAGYPRPVAKPEGVEHGLRFDGQDNGGDGPWRRVFFVPQANLIVVLPQSNDQIVLLKFDLDAALEKSGVDYLFVTSQPPMTVHPGDTFTYPVAVKAKRGPVTFRLDSGPKGMAVSKAGVVSWAVPADAPAGDQDAILTVRDAAGQEVFHTFKLQVVK